MTLLYFSLFATYYCDPYMDPTNPPQVQNDENRWKRVKILSLAHKWIDENELNMPAVEKKPFRYYLCYPDTMCSDDELPSYYNFIIEAKDQEDAMIKARNQLSEEEFESVKLEEFKMIRS